MFIRQLAVTIGTASALALAFAIPAAAQSDAGMTELPSVMAAAPDLPPYAPPAPGTMPMPMPMPMPSGPGMAPQWQGATATPALQLDPRTRDAWLGECRRRTAFYYDSGWGHGKRHKHGKRGHDDHMGYRGGYDYCEAYLDDYYRYYSQAGVTYGHAHMMPMQMTMMPQTREVSGPVEEIVTEEYVPVRTRTIQPRRGKRIRDKRIRVY